MVEAFGHREDVRHHDKFSTCSTWPVPASFWGACPLRPFSTLPLVFPSRAALPFLFDATGVQRMVIVDLVLQFVPREEYLFGVDHDDEITRVDMGCVLRSMFPAENGGNPACEATQYLTIGIGYVPCLLHLTLLCKVSRIHVLVTIDENQARSVCDFWLVVKKKTCYLALQFLG